MKKSGLGSAGAGISYGTNQTIDTSLDTVKGSQGSLIGSTDGSVSMVAGNTLQSIKGNLPMSFLLGNLSAEVDVLLGHV
ncbi:hypothetical protein [Burkholderia metallica]